MLKIVFSVCRFVLQQKLCQSVRDFLSGRKSMKNFDRVKLAK